MRYFKVPSRVFGKALIRREDTTIHFLKLTSRIAIVWDFKEATK